MLHDPLGSWLGEADAERERNPHEPQPEPWRPQPAPEAHTMSEWREIRIADRVCPLPGCSGQLDDDYFCATCGNVSLPRQPVELLPDPAAEAFPPETLIVDEFAPADIGDAA